MQAKCTGQKQEVELSVDASLSFTSHVFLIFPKLFYTFTKYSVNTVRNNEI